MTINTQDVETTDFNIVYYANDAYVKTNCILRQFYSTKNIFEANEIIDGMFLGNINSAYDIEKLQEIGITHVISVLAGFIPPYPNDFKYLQLNALDTTNTDLSNNFESANEFINDAIENKGKILIHCMAGRSRSATILLAYMIKSFGLTIEMALNSVILKRPIVEPNKYFMKQLQEYYDKLYTINPTDIDL